MAHIITTVDERWNDKTALLVYTKPTDRQINAMKRRNSIVENPVGLKIDDVYAFYGDNKVPYKSVLPKGKKQWVAVSGAVVLTIALAIIFSVWMLAFIALGATACAGVKVYTHARAVRQDANEVASLFSQPQVDMTDTHDFMTWALQVHAWYTYPACDYKLPIEKLFERLRDESLRPATRRGRALMHVRDVRDIFAGTSIVDVEERRKEFAALYDRLTWEHENARTYAKQVVDYVQWAKDLGDLAFIVIPQIMHDSDIATTFELKQRIAANAKLPGYTHADADAQKLASKESRVAERVQVILEMARQIQQQEALAAHEGVVALASTVFAGE